MEKIIMEIGASKDGFGAYSVNCEGIYAAGDTIEATKAVPSFLEYYSRYMSLAGMERITGINQRQLSNYLNHRSTPRRKQIDRINEGLHRFARSVLSVTL